MVKRTFGLVGLGKEIVFDGHLESCDLINWIIFIFFCSNIIIFICKTFMICNKKGKWGLKLLLMVI